MTPQRRALTIQVERGTDAVVVRLGGAATIDQADRLNRELRQVAGEPFKRVVMDLSELEFICSMGLGALIVAHIICRRRKAELVLVAPTPAIREVLEMTHLDRIFPIYPCVTAALQ